MDAIIDKIPRPILAGLVTVGIIAVFGKAFSYIQLLLSLFVFGGKNVGQPAPKYTKLQLTGYSYATMAPKAHGR
jgi:hypothetical protein